MPKVIDNIRGRAISEAREILIREGYAALTIREIARRLGIGLGTIYNYFPSKEYLAAGVMLEDWQELTKDFAELHAGHPAEQVVEDLFSLIQTFTRRYDPAWREYEQKILKTFVQSVKVKNVNHVIQTNQNFVVHAMKDIIYLNMIKQNVNNVQ